jgi:hypothetical protein
MSSQRPHVAQGGHLRQARHRRACLLAIYNCNEVPGGTDARVIADEILAHASPTLLVTTVVNVSTEFLAALVAQLKAMFAATIICINAGPHHIDTGAAWTASVLLAGIDVATLHVWSREAQIAICQTLHFE